jgi:predicted aldo/keto reductase-like oxidoreductase
MAALYEDRFLGLSKSAAGTYTWATRDVKPTACTECGTCESKCTQSLDIREELKKASARFAPATSGA